MPVGETRSALDARKLSVKKLWKCSAALRYPIYWRFRASRLADPMQRPERRASDLRPALVFLSGELLAVPIPLEREEVILGRALEADVRINDSKISRQHAMIRTVSGGSGVEEYYLSDL